MSARRLCLVTYLFIVWFGCILVEVGAFTPTYVLVRSLCLQTYLIFVRFEYLLVKIRSYVPYIYVSAIPVPCNVPCRYPVRVSHGHI